MKGNLPSQPFSNLTRLGPIYKNTEVNNTQGTAPVYILEGSGSEDPISKVYSKTSKCFR